MKTIALAGILLCLFARGAFADGAEIGVVDVNSVFAGYYRVAESQEEFSLYQQEKIGALEKKAGEIEPLQQKLRDQDIPEAEREEIQGRMNALRREITESYRDLEQELQEKNHALVEARIEEIISAIGEIASRKGMRLVINREAVLYAGPGTADITSETLEHLNREAPEKPAGPETP